MLKSDAKKLFSIRKVEDNPHWKFEIFDTNRNEVLARYGSKSEASADRKMIVDTMHALASMISERDETNTEDEFSFLYEKHFSEATPEHVSADTPMNLAC